MKFEDYSINITSIPQDEGGGYIVIFPDLPGCVADGETFDEAIAEARDAFNAWVIAEQEDKGDIPAPRTTVDSSCNASRKLCTCASPNEPRAKG